MPQPRIDMQYVLDKTAIEEVITRYFQGLDRALADQVRSCSSGFGMGRKPITSFLRGSDKLGLACFAQRSGIQVSTCR